MANAPTNVLGVDMRVRYRQKISDSGVDFSMKKVLQSRYTMVAYKEGYGIRKVADLKLWTNSHDAIARSGIQRIYATIWVFDEEGNVHLSGSGKSHKDDTHPRSAAVDTAIKAAGLFATCNVFAGGENAIVKVMKAIPLLMGYTTENTFLVR